MTWRTHSSIVYLPEVKVSKMSEMIKEFDQKRTTHLFKNLDKDGDGNLTLDEYLNTE